MEDRNFSEVNCQKGNSKTVKDSANLEKTSKQSNVGVEEIDDETVSKLRGDAIGDTMYSQSSVIRILLQLSDVKWNNKLEEDLCFLWDMTVEKDVCEYLFQLSFPSIGTAIILKYSEPRLIEIIIGILANICSNSESVPDITDIEISIVLNALETDDHLILIQIIRFLVAIVYHRNNKLHFITTEIMDKICFILENSRNKELLVYTMDALSKITMDFKIESELINGNVIDSLLIAYKYLNKKRSNTSDEFEEDNLEKQKCLNFFVQTIVNICSYLNVTSSSLHKEITSKNKELLSEFRNIFRKYKKKENLLPLSKPVTFYFESFTMIFPILKINYDKDIFIDLLNIINVLLKNKVEKVDEFVELTRYLIGIADVNILIKDCENVNCEKNSVFKFISDHKSKCDFDYEGNILSIIKKLSENTK